MGGFVFGLLGRAPEPGDSVDYDGLRFDVLEVEGQRIHRLAVTFVERRDRRRKFPAEAEAAEPRLAPAGPILGRIAPTTFSEHLRAARVARGRAADVSTARAAVAQRRRRSPESDRPSRSGSASSACGRSPICSSTARTATRPPPRRCGSPTCSPARRRSRSRARSSGRSIRRPRRRLAIVQARIADDSGADHGGLVQPGVARGQAQARHARPAARPPAAERVQRALVRPERRLGDRRLRARLSRDRGDLTVKKLRERDRARAAPGARLPGSRAGRRLPTTCRSAPTR